MIKNKRIYKFYNEIRIGPVARIPRFHRGGRGSIPRCGIIFNFFQNFALKFLCIFYYNY